MLKRVIMMGARPDRRSNLCTLISGTLTVILLEEVGAGPWILDQQREQFKLS